MKKVLKSNIEAGSKKSKEPRLLGSIVEEMLHGDSPLAVGYRQYIASLENEEVEERGWHPNTELSVDLKTLLRSDERMRIGKGYTGVLRLDAEAEVEEYRSYDPHFTFTETVPPTAAKRNPHLFDGEYITVTRRDDGSLRLNFKELKTGEDFNPERYALGVYNEICMALAGLIEEA